MPELLSAAIGSSIANRVVDRRAGRDMALIADHPEKSEAERLCADNRKARELFSWQPAYGGGEGLKRGLRETAEWFRGPTNLARYKTERYNI